MLADRHVETLYWGVFFKSEASPTGEAVCVAGFTHRRDRDRFLSAMDNPGGMYYAGVIGEEL